MIAFPLYPYQRDTVEFMKKGACINASFCGSGKTLTSLAAITELGYQTNLIVCPKSVLYNWYNEICVKWLNGHATAFVATGSPVRRKAVYNAFKAQQGVKYLIITYDTMRIDCTYLSQL